MNGHCIYLADNCYIGFQDIVFNCVKCIMCEATFFAPCASSMKYYSMMLLDYSSYTYSARSVNMNRLVEGVETVQASVEKLLGVSKPPFGKMVV